MHHEGGQERQRSTLLATASGLRPAAGLLAVLFALLTIIPMATGPAAVVPLTGATAVALSGLWWVQHHRPLPVTWTAHLAGGMGALVAINALTLLAVTADPLQASNVMLVIIGVGALVDDRRWAGGTVAASLGTCALIAVRAPSPMWRHFAIGLLSAVMGALVLRTVFQTAKRSLEQARQDAADWAVRDELTGLLNRRGLETVGDQALAVAQRMDQRVSLLFIDLDGMKAINDTQGHLAGDALLVETARRLACMFREADAVARVGGDEFAVLVVGADDAHLDDLCERARQTIREASIGVATADGADRTSLVELMHRADIEMYSDKHARQVQRGTPQAATLP